eukprot:3519877-Rhodomonas_salina.1
MAGRSRRGVLLLRMKESGATREDKTRRGSLRIGVKRQFEDRSEAARDRQTRDVTRQSEDSMACEDRAGRGTKREGSVRIQRAPRRFEDTTKRSEAV